MFLLSEYNILERIHLKTNKLLFRAENSLDGKKVLLKVIENIPFNEDTLPFATEFEISKSILNKGIARYLKFERFGNGVIAVIENIEGLPLEAYLKDRKPDIGTSLNITITITEILEHLHRNGMVHQGLCPSHLFINPQTLEIVLLDFSSAFHGTAKSGISKTAILPATLAYISPEQTGRINSEVDIRSDLYSLGIILYEMVTGKLPFETNEALALIHCHIAKSPIPPHHINKSIPVNLSLIILKLLSKNAADRYQSPAGLKIDLETCQDEWNSYGSIKLFKLGQKDFSAKLQNPTQFYGRENEIKALHQSFERVSAGAVEIMLVEGYSGIGKSALVHQIAEVILLQGGFFVEGKFDQFQSNVPYSGFIQAFKKFTDFILTQSELKIAKWKNIILEAVGSNGRVLTDIIPHLELLVGPQPALPELELTETQNRFHYVFSNFIKRISGKEHPLVIFFDDVQWADAASSNLIKTISDDKDLRYFLFICAYRDNEMGVNRVFHSTIKDLHKEGCVIHKIVLSQLSYEISEKIISEILGGKAEDNQEVVKSVVDKSHGNPFFIKAFLNCLYAENIIAFDFYRNSWKWDSARMNQLKLGDNIVELMTGRMQKLPAYTQEVLKIAACLGYHFDVHLLIHTLQETQQRIDEKLMPAVMEGLILMDRANYRFSHDRIQQAAYSLIPDDERKDVHLKIGEALLHNLDNEAKSIYIFEIVNQLNAGRQSIIADSQKKQIAALNLTAGTKAKSSAAYKTSVEYLQTGISLLSNKAWENNYELALQLYTEGAESSFLSGNIASMEEWIELVFKNATGILDKVKAYEIRIKFYIANQQILDAIKTSLQILELLHVRFPAKPSKVHVLIALMKIKLALAGKSVNSLVALPLIKNKFAEAAIRILANVGSAVYFAMPDLFPLVVFRAFSLMIKYGNSPYSGVVCASYGVIMVGGLGNIEAGYRLGNIALQLSDNFETSSYKYQCKFIVNNFIIHWKEHLKNILEPIRKTYWNCLETGNPEFASYCAQLYCMWTFFCGKNLKELTEEMREFLDSLKQLRQEISLNLHKIHTQTVLNLQLLQGNPTELTGEVHNEAAMMEIYKKTKAEPLIFSVYLYKLILLYLFENYHEAALNSKEAGSRLESIAGSAEVIIYYFYDTLTLCSLLHTYPRNEKQKALRSINSNITRIKKFTRFGPMNCAHRLLLIEAEYCRVTDCMEKAALLYDKAIAKAQENEYFNDLSLICELAGKFYQSQQRDFIARQYLLQAFRFYQQWGALAKVNQMREKYDFLREEQSRDNPVIELDIGENTAHYRLNEERSKELDLYSIMKAATAISSEIELDELLKKLIRIAVESTGAQQGYLILKKEEDFFIEAQGSVNTEEEVIVQSVPIKGNESIPEQVIKFVYLTKENLVTGNAIHNFHFGMDGIISKKHAKSMLCMPILHQGTVIGLLYFENDLITDAFTPDRIELLKLLSGQMAISLQNALNEHKKMNALMEREKLLTQINLHEQELLKTKLEIQEQTLNNISAEIHDNIGQTLSFIKLNINTIDLYAPDAAQKKLLESKTLLSKVIQDLRDLAKTFNTDFISKTGLAKGLDQQLLFLKKTDLYETILSVNGEEVKYESHRELVIFRIVQELLNNVVKHAEASEIKITMDYLSDKLKITIQDNGKGFDIQQQQLTGNKGLGLSNIHNRIRLIKGQVFYESKPGKGTNVIIELLK